MTSAQLRPSSQIFYHEKICTQKYSLMMQSTLESSSHSFVSIYELTVNWGQPKNKNYKPNLSFCGMWLYIPSTGIQEVQFRSKLNKNQEIHGTELLFDQKALSVDRP